MNQVKIKDRCGVRCTLAQERKSVHIHVQVQVCITCLFLESFHVNTCPHMVYVLSVNILMCTYICLCSESVSVCMLSFLCMDPLAYTLKYIPSYAYVCEV